MAHQARRARDRPERRAPSRNFFSYLPALFVPCAGRLGAGFGMLILVYIVGIMAAVALPAYQDYTSKARLQLAMNSSQDALTTIGTYYREKQAIPEWLEDAGVPARLADGSQLSFDPSAMVLTVTAAKDQQLVFVPEKDENGQVRWQCGGGETTNQKILPKECGQ